MLLIFETLYNVDKKPPLRTQRKAFGLRGPAGGSRGEGHEGKKQKAEGKLSNTKIICCWPRNTEPNFVLCPCVDVLRFPFEEEKGLEVSIQMQWRHVEEQIRKRCSNAQWAVELEGKQESEVSLEVLTRKQQHI